MSEVYPEAITAFTAVSTLNTMCRIISTKVSSKPAVETESIPVLSPAGILMVSLLTVYCAVALASPLTLKAIRIFFPETWSTFAVRVTGVLASSSMVFWLKFKVTSGKESLSVMVRFNVSLPFNEQLVMPAGTRTMLSLYSFAWSSIPLRVNLPSVFPALTTIWGDSCTFCMRWLA